MTRYNAGQASEYDRIFDKWSVGELYLRLEDDTCTMTVYPDADNDAAVFPMSAEKVRQLRLALHRMEKRLAALQPPKEQP